LRLVYKKTSPAKAGDARYFFFFPLSWYMINAPMVMAAKAAPMSYIPYDIILTYNPAK
jgi:hypothetical protein